MVVCEMMRMYPLLFGAGAVRKCYAFSIAGFVSSHPPPPQPSPRPTLSSRIGFSFTPGVFLFLFRLCGWPLFSLRAFAGVPPDCKRFNTSLRTNLYLERVVAFCDGHWYWLPTRLQLRNSKVYFVAQQLKLRRPQLFPCACLLGGDVLQSRL